MASFFRNSRVTLRQRMFPPEFRIKSEVPGNGVSELLKSVQGILERAVENERSAELKRSDKPAAEQSLNPELVIDFCNGLFAIWKRTESLAEALKGTDNRVKSLQEGLDDLDTLLEENDIEWRDLAGEPYDTRRRDFVPTCQAKPVPGLASPRIAICDKPAIWIRQKLVQAAKGVVERPE